VKRGISIAVLTAGVIATAIALLVALVVFSFTIYKHPWMDMPEIIDSDRVTYLLTLSILGIVFCIFGESMSLLLLRTRRWVACVGGTLNAVMLIGFIYKLVYLLPHFEG